MPRIGVSSQRVIDFCTRHPLIETFQNRIQLDILRPQSKSHTNVFICRHCRQLIFIQQRMQISCPIIVHNPAISLPPCYSIQAILHGGKVHEFPLRKFILNLSFNCRIIAYYRTAQRCISRKICTVLRPRIIAMIIASTSGVVTRTCCCSAS